MINQRVKINNTCTSLSITNLSVPTYRDMNISDQRAHKQIKTTENCDGFHPGGNDQINIQRKMFVKVQTADSPDVHSRYYKCTYHDIPWTLALPWPSQPDCLK